jgi:TolB-like protein
VKKPPLRSPLLALYCLAFSALPLAGQEAAAKPVVAVLPFQAVEASVTVARSAAAFVESALVKTGVLTVVSQAERDRILQAQEAALADCAEEDCAIRIGKLLAAGQIVVGEVVGLGRRLIVNAKIIDINTGQILAADTRGAAGEQELEQVCVGLTLSLVAGALPAVAAGLTAEGKETVAGQEEGPVAGATAGAQPGQVAGEEPRRRQPRRPRRPKTPASAAALTPEQRAGKAARLANTGAIAMQVASIASAISFELQQTSEEAYTSYLQAAADVQDFYSAYAWAYTGHLALGLGADGLWAGGATAVAAAVFKYPQETYVLSRSGRALFAASWSLILSGNVLGLLAGNQYYTSEKLYQDHHQFSERFDAGHAWYLTSRILSYSFWGLGGAGLVCASLLPGDRTPILSGPRDRWLMAGGTALVAAGSLFQSMALNTRELAEDRYKDYLAASADTGDFYNSYLSARTQNVIYSVLAYTLWAGGGAGILGSLFLSPDRGRPKKEPRAALVIVPTPTGLAVWISIDPKGIRL